jgi:enamine deaminase RidA (YjgF/YER057c/UK114 family)
VSAIQRHHSDAPWEREVAYCRLTRAGNLIWISGTAPVEADGATTSPGDAYLQARRCLEIIRDALAEVGGDLSAVTRTRMFVTDIERWEEFGRAHREAFAQHPPATSMVEVSRLIRNDMLIEIEADAFLPS